MVIYKITNLVNGKVYIGQTIQNPKRRWRLHEYSNSCRALKAAIDKYGKNNFQFSIISRADNIEQLNYREAYYIQLFKSLSPKGYNLRYGGENSKLSEETKLRISAANKGQVPWCKGKKIGPLSEETKQKISKSKRGITPKTSIEGKIKQLSALEKTRKRKPIVAVNKITQQILKFSSMCSAEKLGFRQSEISKCCANQFKKYSHKGFWWQYDNI